MCARCGDWKVRVTEKIVEGFRFTMDLSNLCALFSCRRLDFCGGLYFRTTERLLLSTMTSAFHTSDNYLVINKDAGGSENESFWTYFLVPFNPFT